MNVFSLIQRSSFSKRILSVLTAFFFLTTSIFPTVSIAQTILNLPIPGSVVAPTAGFAPVLIKGVNLYPDNPLKFDFIIDKGDSVFSDEEFKKESTKLIKYFLSSLTVPEDEMWVNLSPYEKNRIVPSDFGKTEMGRDLLAQDYMLKQLTASLMNPDDKLGGEFWQRVYSKAQEKYGTTDIPMNTFNKIWILPEKAVVYEHEKGAFVVKSHLKVMLEEDYLALEANKNSTKHGLGGVTPEDLKVVSGVQSAIIKDLLIPEIEREVNVGQTFANLRQIYNAVILASWYKQALKESLLGQVYIDQKKTKGVETADKTVNEQIYNQYVESFKKGVYNTIKEDYNPQTQEVVNRKYFSGGANLNPGEIDIAKDADAAMLAKEDEGLEKVTADFAQVSTTDAALIVDLSHIKEDEIISMIEEAQRQGADVVRSLANRFGINLDWVNNGIEYEIVPVADDYKLSVNLLKNYTLNSVKEMLKSKPYILRGEGAKLWILDTRNSMKTELGIHELGHLIFLTQPDLWQPILSALVTYLHSSSNLPYWMKSDYTNMYPLISFNDLEQANQNLEKFLGDPNNQDKAAVLLIHLSDEFAHMLWNKIGPAIQPAVVKPIILYSRVLKEKKILSEPAKAKVDVTELAETSSSDNPDAAMLTNLTRRQFVKGSMLASLGLLFAGTKVNAVEITKEIFDTLAGSPTEKDLFESFWDEHDLETFVREHQSLAASIEAHNLTYYRDRATIRKMAEVYVIFSLFTNSKLAQFTIKSGVSINPQDKVMEQRLLGLFRKYIGEFDVLFNFDNAIDIISDNVFQPFVLKSLNKNFQKLKSINNVPDLVFAMVQIQNDLAKIKGDLPRKIAVKFKELQEEVLRNDLEEVQTLFSEKVDTVNPVTAALLIASVLFKSGLPDVKLAVRNGNSEGIVINEADGIFNIQGDILLGVSVDGQDVYMSILDNDGSKFDVFSQGAVLLDEKTKVTAPKFNLSNTPLKLGINPNDPMMGPIIASLGGMIGEIISERLNNFPAELKDSAMIETDTKGGIDLNPTILNTEIKRNGRGVIIPAFKGPISNLNGVEGFVPNIINVTPITNLQLLLGLDTKPSENPQQQKPTEVSYNLSFLPTEKKEEFTGRVFHLVGLLLKPFSADSSRGRVL